MVDPKVEKLEHRIKELNAIRGEYRTEVDEAEAQLKRRKITKEEHDRIKSKCEQKMVQINVKVKVCHDELHELRDKNAVGVVVAVNGEVVVVVVNAWRNTGPSTQTLENVALTVLLPPIVILVGLV